MSALSPYDKALAILLESFQAHTNIAAAKQSAKESLTALLESHPDSENEVRLAILHFYNQCGLGCFILYDKKNSKNKELQIITRIKNRAHNLYTQRICDFLHEHKPTLYASEPSEKDFDELFAFVDENLDLSTQATKREMIRAALRSVFGINARDGLFFKDGSIKLFKFDYEMVKINNEIRQINTSAHINVLNTDDRMVLDNALSQSKIQSLIIQNTLAILQNDIALTRIDPIAFNKNFSFFAIQKLRIYVESLHIRGIDSLSQSIYCKELSEKYAWLMYEVVAKELLELCAAGNANAMKFIEFYNGGAITIGGRVMKKPIITDNNGNPWTLPLIKDALMAKRNVEFDISQMQKRADGIEESLHAISAQIAHNEREIATSSQREKSYQEQLDSKNQALRALVDRGGEKDSIKALSEDINTLISSKAQALQSKEEAQKALAQLNQEQIRLLEEQSKLREQISYALKRNKDKFLQYDLLSRALADAIHNAKEIV